MEGSAFETLIKKKVPFVQAGFKTSLNPTKEFGPWGQFLLLLLECDFANDLISLTSPIIAIIIIQCAQCRKNQWQPSASSAKIPSWSPPPTISRCASYSDWRNQPRHTLYSSETLIHLSIKPWLAFWIKLTSLSFISGSQLLLKLCKRWCKIKAVICMLEITWAFKKCPTLVQIMHSSGFQCLCNCCNRQRKLQASSLEQCSIRNVISDGYGWFLEPLQKRSCKAHWG